MSFNVSLPMGRSSSVTGLSGVRVTSKDPKSVDSVTYDGDDLPISVTYTLVDDTVEVITMTYDESGNITVGGIEYRGYGFNIQTASLYPNSAGSYAYTSSVYQHAETELKTIELLGLSTTNMLTDSSGYDLILASDGSILFTPTIS